MNGAYGKEFILDMHDCSTQCFTRGGIRYFFLKLVALLDMVGEDVYFWDDLDVPEDERETEPHLVGTSAIQFIRTSNITIHTLTLMKRVYLNVFSCKPFDEKKVEEFCVEWFEGHVVSKTVLERV